MKTLAVLLLAVPCWCSTWGGLREYNRGDHQAAFRTWLSDSQRGNRESQYHLGLLYRDGQGTAKDLATARQWLQRSARAGCDAAQTEYGRFLDQGWGGPRDSAEARTWFERAVLRGNRSAMNEMGLLYFRGRGGPVDNARAFELFYRASEGSRAAMFNLGLMYETGRGRPQDLVEAVAWYSMAASKGEPGAAEERDALSAGLLSAQRERLQQRMKSLERRQMWVASKSYWYVVPVLAIAALWIVATLAPRRPIT